jgi:hypothetical protein
MRTLSSIVLAEPGVELARYAAVTHLVIFADEDVNVVEAVHQNLLTRGMIREEGWPAKP